MPHSTGCAWAHLGQLSDQGVVPPRLQSTRQGAFSKAPMQGARNPQPWKQNPPGHTWLEEKVVPRLLRNLAALRVRSALKLEAPTASHRPCS